MNRKFKLFFSLASLCLSVAMLCFGVYSAMSVSYTVNGSVSYEVNDVFARIDLSVYRAMSSTPVNDLQHNTNIGTIQSAGDNIPIEDFDKLSIIDSFSTYEGNTVTKPGEPYEKTSPNIDLVYGSPDNENQGYAFYIVIDVTNLGSETINAQITAPTSLENTILRDSGNVEIAADGTERIVLGLALDDVTTGIKSAGFTYTIKISRGELPAEPITDMLFSVDEGNETATLTSYTGSGGDVVIPETIGYGTVSSMTLTFKKMEDIISNDNMMYLMYFYQDLKIKIPNQEAAQPIENPLLWLSEKMDSSLPEDYFPMTIQTVESYTIDQEDYNKYATLDPDAATMLAFGPIQMIRGGLCNSVVVQYGEEEKSFTFNMENYNDNAAVNEGDDSEITTPIDEFMSKMEKDPESLLPVTYSNFEYNVLVKEGEYSVTSIGFDAFRYCSNLTSIEIPSSVTSIGDRAFSNCSALKTVTFGEDSKLESIGDYAFCDCSNLTSIEIPSSVTSIGQSAFEYCSALETVTFGANSQLGSIGSYAFRSCSNLTSTEIPSSVTSIGSFAFQNCYALAEVYNYSKHIPQVTIGTTTNSDLGHYAKVVYNPSNLQGEKPATRIKTIYNVQYYKDGEDLIALAPSVARDSLTTLILDSSTTEINQYAFSGCSNLTSIEIPSSVTSIGYDAFENCYALAEVYNYSTHIPQVTIGNSSSSTNGYLGQYAKVVYNHSDLTGGKPGTRIQTIGNVQYYVYGEDFIALAPSVARGSLTTLTLDSSTTEINREAFSDCSNLTSIEIPSSVKSIGDFAFNNCDALETVTFGANSQLESIGSYAFCDCSALTSIEIPSSVKSIGDWAFFGCSSLKNVTFKDITTEWTVTSGSTSNTIKSQELQSPSTMATYLTSNYDYYTWTKKQ